MPDTVRKLTEDQEQKLASALSEVATLVNSGTTPDDAICKVASAKQIPAGHIGLMVNAYNTGRSLSQIQNHDKLLDKAASFPVAHAKEILERLYPTNPLSEAQKQAAEAISAEYGLSPKGWVEGHRKTAKANPIFPPSDRPAAKPLPEAGFAKVASALREKELNEKQAVETKHNLVSATYRLAKSCDQVVHYFKTAGCLPYPEVRKNTQAVYGHGAATFLDRIAEGQRQFQKQASLAPHVVRWDTAPYSLIEKALQDLKAFGLAKEAQETLEKTAAKKENPLRPFAGAPQGPQSIWVDQSSTVKAADGSGLGTFGMGALVGTLGSELTSKLSPDKETEVQKKLKDLSDPVHEDRLKAIRTQTMLYDLISNDQVISGYDPKEVASAYNYISQIAPRAAQRRLITQALLRKYLAQGGNLDPYDLNDVLANEERLGKIDALAADPNNALKLDTTLTPTRRA